MRRFAFSELGICLRRRWLLLTPYIVIIVVTVVHCTSNGILVGHDVARYLDFKAIFDSVPERRLENVIVFSPPPQKQSFVIIDDRRDYGNWLGDEHPNITVGRNEAGYTVSRWQIGEIKRRGDVSVKRGYVYVGSEIYCGSASAITPLSGELPTDCLLIRGIDHARRLDGGNKYEGALDSDDGLLGGIGGVPSSMRRVTSNSFGPHEEIKLIKATESQYSGEDNQKERVYRDGVRKPPVPESFVVFLFALFFIIVCGGLLLGRYMGWDR